MTLQRDESPWYKQRWPWFLISGPAIVVVAGLTTFWLAVWSSDGLVADDYYKQGMAVNQLLQRNHRAGSLGLHGDLMRSGQDVRLMLSAAEEITLPVAIVLRLTHPTRPGQDQALEMTSGGAGVYDGKLNADLNGRWLVSLEDPAGQWRLQGEWQSDSGVPLRLRARAEK